ncbi:alpha/beta hydrolase [Desulfuribacillus alkaliarsenatis]|uniref:alpha/beta hydrolase n=1 Tax=Desulfuribacillus alkaliarsenatis TaxID=766136 RepID=UPI00159F05D1|nr:alpha/beta fold hydrolase [Desulfuribacillus alkaliarsenatis]
MKACLLIHGFTGSPYEIEPLAEALRQEGYAVEMPILAGHGHDEDLQDVCWTDWISSAEQALKPMVGKYEEINIVGFSMGSLIATYLSTQYPVARLVLLSPAIYYINYRQLFENMSVAIKKRFKDSLSDEFKQYVAKATNTPLRSVIDFRRLTQQLSPYLEQVSVPTLILQGKKDMLVEPDSARHAYEAIKSPDKKLLFLENSPHIMCRGEEHELVNEYVIDFLKGVNQS